MDDLFYSSELNPDDIVAQLSGCSCGSSEASTESTADKSPLSCLDTKCTCVSLSRNSVYSQDGRLIALLNPPSIFECNDECTCQKDSCCNRVLQRVTIAHQNAMMTVYNTGDARGQGVRARVALAAGTCLGTYMGEVVTPAEARIREQEQSSRVENKHTYILCLREIVPFSSDHKKQRLCIETWVDGSPDSDFELNRDGLIHHSRFLLSRINHSCTPNLLVTPVRVNSPSIPYLVFFTRRDISVGEELTFDYGFGEEICGNDFNASNHVHLSSQICLCGTAKCKGFLPRYT